jgi:hypothetical protein
MNQIGSNRLLVWVIDINIVGCCLLLITEKGAREREILVMVLEI